MTNVQLCYLLSVTAQAVCEFDDAVIAFVFWKQANKIDSNRITSFIRNG